MSLDIDAGCEVAPGEASDVEVANAHACSYLIISDARRLAALVRVQLALFPREIMLNNLMMISCEKRGVS